MIKIEKIFEGGKAEVGSDAVFEGQLLTHDDFARIKVTSGSILVSIDEKDLVTLNAEVAPTQDKPIEIKTAPQPGETAIQELPTSPETVDSKNLSTSSTNSTSPKDSTPHSAKSTNTTKK